jgi:hypothetical protein
MRVQSTTEVSQEEFCRIMKRYPEGTLGFKDTEHRSYTLPNGVQYYTSVYGLGDVMAHG